MSNAEVRGVPAWPVIVLTFDAGDAVADPAGVGEPIRVAVADDFAVAAAEAATEAAHVLEVPRCRVQGVSPDGDVWVMIIDAESGQLEALDERTVKTSVPARHNAVTSFGARLVAIPRRWWLVIGTAAVAVTAVAVVLVPRTLVVPAPVQTAIAVTTAPQLAPAPDAGQLPVSPPVGWDTYASWVVAASEPDAAAVLAGRDTLILSDGADVIAVDSSTGAERWRSGTARDVTSLYVGGDGEVVFAAHGTTGVSVLLAASGESIGYAETTARSITLSDVPFADLPGQAGAVLIGQSWARRQVPATSVPVGTVGTGLVSVSVEQQAMWMTVSDDPVLPAAITLVSPQEGLSLTRAVGLFDDRLVLAWGNQTGVKAYTVDQVASSGELQRVGAVEAAAGSSSSTVSYDRSSGLLAMGSLLVNVTNAGVVASGGGGLTAQAGYAWSAQGSAARVRISPDGATVPMPRAAVVPDLVLPDGRAIVRAALGTAGSAYYALDPHAPAPTPSPSTTDGEQS